MGGGIVERWTEDAPRLPWMTFFLSVSLLIMMTFYAFLGPVAQQAMIDVGGMHPGSVAAALSEPLTAWWSNGALTLASALFIHASWLHLAGNLAYLWVFGMAVERTISGLGLFAVFIFGGAAANALVALNLSDTTATVIGASGAVSAVVGCYLGLFPRRRIGLYIPLGLYLQFAKVPALLVIGSWFTLQLVYTVFDPMSGTVAFWTHLAGFTLGIMLALLFRALEQVRSQ